MRISSYNQYSSAQSNISKIQSKVANQQLQLTTGKSFNKASENPIKAKQVEVIQNALGRISQYEKNINDAKGILETTETLVKNAYTALESVNNEIIKALNGTYAEEDMKSIATVVDKVIEQMVGLGNTKHLNRFVFSGEKIMTKPFDYDGNSVVYNGSDQNVRMEISAYADVKVHQNGNEYLTKTIDDLIKIRDLIKAEDRTGLESYMEANKTNMDSMMNHVADVGVSIKSLETVYEGFVEQKLNLESRQSDIEDIDFTELYVEYSISQRTYQGTLQASTLMFQTSILDYI